MTTANHGFTRDQTRPLEARVGCRIEIKDRHIGVDNLTGLNGVNGPSGLMNTKRPAAVGRKVPGCLAAALPRAAQRPSLGGMIGRSA